MEQQINVCATIQKTYTQILFAFAGCLVVISDGMHYGWSAPVIPILLTTNSTLHVTTTTAEWLETTYLIGGVLFFPFTILIVDRCGRKTAILVCSVLQGFAWLFLMLANGPACLFVARFVAGMSGDLCYVAAPIYISEITDEQIRGFLSTTVTFMMLIGVLVIYAIGPFVSFATTSVIGLCIVALHLAIFSRMPETPYHLLSSNRKESARRALTRLRPGQDNNRLLEAIADTIAKEKQQKGKLRDLFLKHNRRVLFISTYLTFGEHFGGFSVTLMNLHTILDQNESPSTVGSSSFTAIVFSVLMLITVVVSSFFLDKYGRKPLLIASSALTGGCLLALGAYFHCQALGRNLERFGWVPLACVSVYAVVFKAGLGFIPNILCAELYATNVRALGMCLNDVMYLGFAFLSIAFYQKFNEMFGLFVVLYIFAVCAFSVSLVVYFIVPETKQKTLEEIQTLLKNPTGRQSTYESID